MMSHNAKEWQEYESLLEDETRDLVELPKDRKAIGSRWVFKVKHQSDGRVERYKCRLVAKGYDETFSPVMLTGLVTRTIVARQLAMCSYGWRSSELAQQETVNCCSFNSGG
ncbi:uncharacterized protein LOC131535967 [Onychostoma macrolepis]|uniref:uncharacterized protein LOC131535967 n=1 Tax=Onychostoma macrolepis TaxID=369639 RepID=UPI00272BA8F6|nr:uncharacterized protein LOC131535967 [Onychostoma macrolepis]